VEVAWFWIGVSGQRRNGLNKSFRQEEMSSLLCFGNIHQVFHFKTDAVSVVALLQNILLQLVQRR
jgi:hypothetical protein